MDARQRGCSDGERDGDLGDHAGQLRRARRDRDPDAGGHHAGCGHPLPGGLRRDPDRDGGEHRLRRERGERHRRYGGLRREQGQPGQHRLRRGRRRDGGDWQLGHDQHGDGCDGRLPAQPEPDGHRGGGERDGGDQRGREHRLRRGRRQPERGDRGLLRRGGLHGDEQRLLLQLVATPKASSGAQMIAQGNGTAVTC